MGEVIYTYDLDQTVAFRVVEAHMRVYNEELGLNMTPEEVAASEMYPKTFDVPQIMAYRALGDWSEEEFQRVRREIRTSDRATLGLSTLPEAVEAARMLNEDPELRFGGYYTVRPPEVEAATKLWLANHEYPDPEKVVICSDPKDKIVRLVDDWMLDKDKGVVPGRTVVLFDDKAQSGKKDDLVQGAHEIHIEDPLRRAALGQLVIVKFGYLDGQSLDGDIYPETGLRVLKLPSWGEEDRQQLARVRNDVLRPEQAVLVPQSYTLIE